MGFVKVDIEQKIEQKRIEDEQFKKLWDDSREEYRLIGEMTALRKAGKITQEELARLTGSRQQVISRIEKRENSPSLKSFCNILRGIIFLGAKPYDFMPSLF